MDALLAFLKPEVVSAMVLAPILLQLIRAKIPAFAAQHAAVLNFLVVAGTAGWALRAEVMPPTVQSGLTFLAQIAVAWLLSDLWFRAAVSPVSNSAGNPVLPPPGGAK